MHCHIYLVHVWKQVRKLTTSLKFNGMLETRCFTEVLNVAQISQIIKTKESNL